MFLFDCKRGYSILYINIYIERDNSLKFDLAYQVKNDEVSQDRSNFSSFRDPYL